MEKKTVLGAAFLLLTLVWVVPAKAQTEEVKPEVAAKVRTTVADYVQREEQLKGGFFLRDSQDKTIRDLQFDYVHEGVEKTQDNLYSVCVDLLDTSKNRLDVDFYLQPTSSGNFQVSTIKIHKVNGVERKD
ncbi:MAG: hypothetical protein IH846_09045 [Acidobacteria bacterium]|nr:hypothetical protein [Acidobacteriota bacterium]